MERRRRHRQTPSAIIIYETSTDDSHKFDYGIRKCGLFLASRVNGRQTRMAGVKWDRAISITLSAFALVSTFRRNCHALAQTRCIFFDAVSHFCPSFSNKATATVYSAIPPRTRVHVRVVSNHRRGAKTETREGATTVLYRNVEKRITAA